MLMLAQPTTASVKAKFFRGFADAARLAILETLRESPRSVGEIVEKTALTQSNVSNHLSCLKGCGLVVSEKRGRHVYYALSDDRLGAMLSLSEEILAEVAKGVYECTRYDAGERER